MNKGSLENTTYCLPPNTLRQRLVHQNTRGVVLYSVLGEMYKNETTLEDKLWDSLTNFAQTEEASYLEVVKLF